MKSRILKCVVVKTTSSKGSLTEYGQVYSKYMDTDANIKMLEDKLAVLIQAGVDGKADPLDDLRISNIRVLIKILNITR